MMKFKIQIFIVMVMAAFFTYSKDAYAFDMIHEEECYEGDYITGPVSFAPAVDMMFSGTDYLTVDLLNIDENYIVEEVIVNYHDTYKYDTVLPIGTYEVFDIQFEKPVANMKYSISPERFVITEKGVKGVKDNVIWCNVDYVQYEPVKLKNRFVINDGEKFSGIIQLSIYDKTDTIYPDTEDYRRDQLTHFTIDGESEGNVELSAGKYCISNINAYDKDQNPLNVYYNPNYITLSRKNATNDDYLMTQKIYVFSKESELAEEVKKEVKNTENGYILKTAEQMKEYMKRENESYDYQKDQNNDIWTVYDGDIPEDVLAEPAFDKGNEEDEREIVDEAATTEQIEELEIVDSEIKNSGNLDFKYIGVAFCILLIIGFCVYIRFKSKKNKTMK